MCWTTPGALARGLAEALPSAPGGDDARGKAVPRGSSKLAHSLHDQTSCFDLFCGAGGATRGLQLAGFDVTGVDITASPRYVGDAFLQGDALEASLGGYDFVWASPPCQAFTAYRRRPGHVKARENLIPAVRERLSRLSIPWVIENVQGAPLHDARKLCGSMFGLDVRRHRFFETSFPMTQPQCRHHEQLPRFAHATNRRNLRRTVEVGVYRIPLGVQRAAMGID